MTYTIEQFGKDLGAGMQIDTLKTNIATLTHETIKGADEYGDTILHLAFKVNKAIATAVVMKIKSFGNFIEIMKNLLATANHDEFTPLELLSNRDDAVIKEILGTLLDENNKEFLQTILADGSSAFGNYFEHLLAVENKIDSLMQVAQYKLDNDIKFDTNTPGNSFYFELCVEERYSAINAFLVLAAPKIDAQQTILSRSDIYGKTLLHKAITAYDSNNNDTNTLLEKIFSMTSSADLLQSLFSGDNAQTLEEFIKNIDLLSKLKNSTAFKGDSGNFNFVQFLTKTKLIDKLAATLDGSGNKSKILDAIETFIGTDLTDKQYEEIFFIHPAGSKKYSALTKLTAISPVHNYLKNTVCPKVANALAEKDLEALDDFMTLAQLEKLKTQVEYVKSSLPDNFAQCNTIVIDYIQKIELKETAIQLEGVAENLQNFQRTLRDCLIQNSRINNVESDTNKVADHLKSLKKDVDSPCANIEHVIKATATNTRTCVFEEEYTTLGLIAGNITEIAANSEYCKDLRSKKKEAANPSCALRADSNGVKIKVLERFITNKEPILKEVSKENTANLHLALKVFDNSVSCDQDFQECLTKGLDLVNGQDHLIKFCSDVHNVADKTPGFQFENSTMSQNDTHCSGNGSVSGNFTDELLAL